MRFKAEHVTRADMSLFPYYRPAKNRSRGENEQENTETELDLNVLV